MNCRLIGLEIHPSVMNPIAEPKDRRVNVKWRAVLVKVRQPLFCHLWAQELRVLCKKPPGSVWEHTGLRTSQDYASEREKEERKGGREILFTAFPLVFSPHEKNGLHVTEWIKDARVHCLRCWLWGRLNGVVVNNYVIEIALLCITLGVACFVDASDLWRQITPPCVNHFVKVNQAVFHNSFWPLGYNLIH